MPPEQPSIQAPTPQPPAVPTPPAGHYDFIMNAQPHSKMRLPNPLAKLPKMLQFAVLALILVLIFVVGFSVLGGKKSDAPSNSLALLQQQQEIARVSKLALTDSTDQATKDLAEMTVSTITSQQKTLEDIYVGKGKKPVSVKILDLKKDTTTDDALTSAKQNNSYDATFTKYLKSSIATYQSNLSEAYKSASSKTKPSLADAFSSNATLLTYSLLK